MFATSKCVQMSNFLFKFGRQSKCLAAISSNANLVLTAKQHVYAKSNLYTTEHEQLRKTLGKIIEKDINPFVNEWEENGIFPAHELFKKLGQAGLLGITRPVEYGGLGLDYSYSMAFFEELGTVDCGGVPMGIIVHTDCSTPALAMFGSEELKKEFLVPSIAGDVVSCVGISEPHCGSDVANIRTKAVRKGDDLIINGGKMWTTNGCQADWMCLLANTRPYASMAMPVEKQVHKLNNYGEGMDVPSIRISKFRKVRELSVIIKKTQEVSELQRSSIISNPGITMAPYGEHLHKQNFNIFMGVHVSRRIDKLGMRSSDTAEIYFEDVKVPAKYIIGEEGQGFTYQMLQFQDERLSGVGLSITQMSRIISDTIEYCKQRTAFGQPIINSQVIHFRLAELQTEVEALRALTYKAVESKLDGEDITLLASMAKLKGARLSRELTDSCLQYWGGMGFTSDVLVSRSYRDSRLFSIGGGTDEMMLGIICKYMGILPKPVKK